MRLGASLGKRSPPIVKEGTAPTVDSSSTLTVMPTPDAPTTISAPAANLGAPEGPVSVSPVPPDIPKEAPKPITVDDETMRTQYWVRGVLVTRTPETITIDARNAAKPSGVPSQDALSLEIPTANGTLHLALASAPEPEMTTTNTRPSGDNITDGTTEVPNGVQLSEGQSPGASDDIKDEPER